MNTNTESRWQPITVAQLAAFGVGLGVFLMLLFKSEPGFIALLDSANLLFHEAGHPFYGLFCSRLTVYGGTMGQLTFPVVLIVSFWRKSEPIAFATSWIWFFENWLNIARYMADSRALELPLVGGGEHDWNLIFFSWNILSYDTLIASITKTIGWIGMITAMLWVCWRAWQDRNRPCPADSMANIDLARLETPNSKRFLGFGK